MNLIGQKKIREVQRYHQAIRELTILGRERRSRLDKTKSAITEVKAVQLYRKHNFKDLLSE